MYTVHRYRSLCEHRSQKKLRGCPVNDIKIAIILFYCKRIAMHSQERDENEIKHEKCWVNDNYIDKNGNLRLVIHFVF